MRNGRNTAWFLTLAMAGLMTAAQQKSVARVQQKPVAAVQQKPVALANPNLKVTCDLACNWTIDGQKMGAIDAGASQLAAVAAGAHAVTAETADGFDSLEMRITVKSAGQSTVALKLEPVRAARLALSKLAIAPKIAARITVPASAAQSLAVNPVLNKIYVSGGASAGQQVAEIDGGTWAVTVLGQGSGAAVDTATGHVWAGGVYDASVLVYDGTTRALIRTVRLGGCPVGAGYDATHGRAWVGAQCGYGDDPTFAVDGTTFQMQTRGIGSSGVYWGNPMVNAATGRVYLGASRESGQPPTSLRIDPGAGPGQGSGSGPGKGTGESFAQTVNGFGGVGAIDSAHNRLFAVPFDDSKQLQIVSGGPAKETILRTVKLAFAANPGALAVNPVARRVYATDAADNRIVVLSETTGAVLATIPLGAGVSPMRLAVDAGRKLLYALVTTADGTQLLVLDDVGTTPSVRGK